MRTRHWVVLVVSASCGTIALDARADDCEAQGSAHSLGSSCIDVDNLWLRPGASLFLASGATESTPAGEVGFGVVVGYQRRPITLGLSGPSLDPRPVYVVDNQLNVSYLLALGITDRFELTLVAPVTFYQDGAGYNSILGTGEVLTRSVVRDPRLGAAWTLVGRERTADADGFALTARFEVAAPLGDGEAFAGARGGTFVPAVTASYQASIFQATAEVGARIRAEEPMAGAMWGTQLSTSLGANVLVWNLPQLSVGAEAFALPVLAAQPDGAPDLVPAEWLASVRAAPFFAGDVFFQIAGGSSLPFTDSAATSPELRFLASGGYAPRALDSDRDGVLDRDDKCPGKKEDRDGFQDQDGCPDPDNDKDGIPDERDRCRDAAETIDNFQDEDGCPDLDDDGDTIPDEEDECRNQKEDKDGFDDADGCPDPDNDGDKIPDAKDGCPLGAEDMDGFNDADGCPDPDNDSDGVLDAADQCPRDREDKDGFSDGDGCPDLDNDEDGVLDGADVCPTDAETLDGNKDDDGCPEPGAKSLVRIDKAARVVFEGGGSWKPGKAEPSDDLAKKLALVARLLQGRVSGSVVIIEAYSDRGGGDALATSRAAEVRRIFVAAGIPKERITAAAGDSSTKRPAGAAGVDISLVRASEASHDASPDN